MKSPTERLVIGLDSSTQSAKAIAWDRTGHMVAEGRAPIPLSNPGLGRFEQDPEDWWTACRAALQACTKQIDAGAVDALAISNQRETVAFLDAEGRALHPALTWLDERTRAEVAEVSELIGPETVHRITGRYPDVILCLYRFLWIKKHRPDVWERTACFADVQAFLVRRLAGGDWRTGWISADPFGLFDVEAKRWSPVILDALDLDETRLGARRAAGHRARPRECRRGGGNGLARRPADHRRRRRRAMRRPRHQLHDVGALLHQSRHGRGLRCLVARL